MCVIFICIQIELFVCFSLEFGINLGVDCCTVLGAVDVDVLDA